MDKPTALSIDVLDHAFVSILGIFIEDVLGYIKRDVRHAVGEVEEEWVVFVFFYKLDGFISIATCDGALIDRQLDNFFITHQWGVPKWGIFILVLPTCILSHAARFSFVVGMTHVVGVWDAEVAIETVRCR